MFAFVAFAPVHTVVSAFGVPLCVGGMLVLAWTRQHLGRNGSQTVANPVGHEPVTSGPYRHLRQPMYAGGLIACIGACIGSAIACAAARSSFS